MEGRPRNHPLVAPLSASKLLSPFQVTEKDMTTGIKDHADIPSSWKSPSCCMALLSLTSPTPNIIPLLQLSEHQTQEKTLCKQPPLSVLQPYPSWGTEGQNTAYFFECVQRNKDNISINYPTTQAPSVDLHKGGFLYLIKGMDNGTVIQEVQQNGAIKWTSMKAVNTLVNGAGNVMCSAVQHWWLAYSHTEI